MPLEGRPSDRRPRGDGAGVVPRRRSPGGPRDDRGLWDLPRSRVRPAHGVVRERRRRLPGPLSDHGTCEALPRQPAPRARASPLQLPRSRAGLVAHPGIPVRQGLQSRPGRLGHLRVPDPRPRRPRLRGGLDQRSPRDLRGRLLSGKHRLRDRGRLRRGAEIESPGPHARRAPPAAVQHGQLELHGTDPRPAALRPGTGPVRPLLPDGDTRGDRTLFPPKATSRRAGRGASSC